MFFLFVVRVSEPSSRTGLRVFIYCDVLARSFGFKETVISAHHIDKGETKVRLMTVLSLSCFLSPILRFPSPPSVSPCVSFASSPLRGPG